MWDSIIYFSENHASPLFLLLFAAMGKHSGNLAKRDDPATMWREITPIPLDTIA